MKKKLLASIICLTIGLLISFSTNADLDQAIASAETGEKDKEEWDWYWYGMSIYKRPKVQPTVCEPNRIGYLEYIYQINTSSTEFQR